MKKIYSLTLAGIALFGSITAQNPFEMNGGRQKAVLAPNAKLPYSKKANVSTNAAAKVATGPFRLQVEPIGDIMTQKGLDLTSTTPNQDLFLSAIFMDSTVRISSPTSTRFVDDHFSGSILDPKSIYLQSSFTPIVGPTDGYTLDTVFIPASYVKVTPTVDTLYTYIVWGDTTQTTVWNKGTTGTFWVAPISGWRTNVLGSIVTGAVGAAGNKVKSNVPAANRMLVKYVLTNSDSVPTAGQFRYIQIVLPTPAMIPANAIVSCFWTFVPGTTYAASDCVYSFSGASVPQNRNGIAAIVWGQTSPALTALSDYVDHQVDPNGYNMGQSYFKQLRHAVYPLSYRTHHWGDLTGAPAIVYSIGGPTIPTGIKAIENTNVSLSQNVPNPFTKESVVRFTLAKDVNSAVFTVTDIMGRVITSEKVETTTGTHTVKLGSYAAGVYYYSINVDGTVTTKKMIVE